MNRKQKIIVSVTGIFIVLLILVGLTYAYFLTQITGNTNPKSISVTTANLVLEYGDGNGVLEVGDNLRPGNSVNFKTSNGTTVNEKTFTVTNSGDYTNYVVVIENVNITNSSGNTTTFESNDFLYTLTCSSSKNYECFGYEDVMFPLNDSVLISNEIYSGEQHTYTLTMEYLETNENQSNDMGKTFTARINIKDIKQDNPYSDNTNSLAYNIINNAMGLTESESELDYAKLESSLYARYNMFDKALLSPLQDNYGTSYIYSGNVKNNYIEFNGMCWRIVRIQGDGSVKLALSKQDLCSTITSADTTSAFIGTGDYGYIENTDGTIGSDYENSANRTTSMKYKFNTWLNGTLDDGVTPRFSANIKNKIKSDKIFIEDKTIIDGFYEGVFKSSSEIYFSLVYSKQAQTKENHQIHTIKLDEWYYAGENSGYLIDNAKADWWTHTLYDPDVLGDSVVLINSNGGASYFLNWANSEKNLRPIISLIPGIEIESGGIGTIDNPYVIKNS